MGKKKREWDEERCRACGCYMEEIDCSTESGWDYDFKCNNPKM